MGGWQQCTAPCGPEGVRKRTVLCVRTVSGEERVLHPVECKHLLKPKPLVPCNRDVPCGQDWAVGIWEEVFLCPFCTQLTQANLWEHVFNWSQRIEGKQTAVPNFSPTQEVAASYNHAKSRIW